MTEAETKVSALTRKPRARAVEIVQAPIAPATPMELLDRARTDGASVEVLERLMAMQERWEAAHARRAFEDAIAAAKAEIPVIEKNRQAGFDSKSGGTRTEYAYEDLGQIARTIDPILGKHGLSYRWKTSAKPGEPVAVTCIIAHRAGHLEETTLTAGRDETGSKNAVQAMGSTITYLQRYTLKAALGLAAAKDDDGHATGQTSDGPITDAQVEELQGLIAATGTKIGPYLAHIKAPSLSDIPASRFEFAKGELERKAKKLAEGGKA